MSFGALAFLFLWYPYVGKTVLETFRCDDAFRRSDGEPEDSPYLNKSYLKADYGIDCNSRSYKLFLVYAAICVPGIILGVPFMFFWSLWQEHDRMQPKDIDAVTEEIFRQKETDDVVTRDKAQIYVDLKAAVANLPPGSKKAADIAVDQAKDALVMARNHGDPQLKHLHFLFVGYRPAYVYFEAIDLFRRLALTSIIPALYPQEDKIGMLYAVTLISMLFAALFVVTRPYADPGVAAFANIISVALVLIFYFGIILYTEARLDSDDKGHWNRAAIGIILICLTAILPVLIIFFSLRQEDMDFRRDVLQPTLTALRTKTTATLTALRTKTTAFKTRHISMTTDDAGDGRHDTEESLSSTLSTMPSRSSPIYSREDSQDIRFNRRHFITHSSVGTDVDTSFATPRSLPEPVLYYDDDDTTNAAVIPNPSPDVANPGDDDDDCTTNCD